jgi:hypothetical protein
VARRATVIADYRRKHPDLPIVLVETGNVLKQSENLDDPASRFVVEALEQLGSDAVHTTAGDLRRLVRLAERGELPKELRADYVATNLETRSGPFAAKPYAIRTVVAASGGERARVGILAVAGEAVSTSGGPATLPAADALRRYLPEVEAQSDLVVVLARAGDAELTRLARQFPGIDVICNGSPSGEGREFPKIGTTVIVEGAHGGVALGMLEIAWDASGRIESSRNVLVPLPPQVPEDPRLSEIGRKAHDASMAFQEEEARRAPPVVMPSIFAGSAACKDCHQKAYAVWAKSGHAHALDTLRRTHDEYNGDCLECHVTGYGVAQGFVNALRTPALGGIHCEGCHGPSTAHAGNPQNMHPGLGEMRTFRRPVRKDFCLRCHTPENSPRFDHDTYWKKVAH